MTRRHVGLWPRCPVTGKASYGSEGSALLALDVIQERSTRRKVPVRVYLCSCAWWHLTSLTEEENARIEAERAQREDHR